MLRFQDWGRAAQFSVKGCQNSLANLKKLVRATIHAEPFGKFLTYTLTALRLTFSPVAMGRIQPRWPLKVYFAAPKSVR